MNEYLKICFCFNAILSSAHIAVIMVNDNGEACIWSKAAELIFGYTAEEMLGRKVDDLIIPKKHLHAHEKGFSWLRGAGEGKHVDRTMELSALRKNGEEFPIEISFAAPALLHGKWHSTAIVRDITKRRNIERALQRTTAELEVILQNAGAGIALVRHNRFEWMNEKFKESLGYGGNEADGLHVSSIFPQETDFSEAEKQHFAKLRHGETVVFEHHAKKRDGSLFWGRGVARAVDPSDLSKGIIVILEDFTERRRMEEELRRAKEEAEEATKLKDKFVSLVAHDLRAPFTSILCGLELIEKGELGGLNEEQKKIFKRSLKRGWDLWNMVDKLLDIGRIATGKIAPQYALFNVRASINSVRDQYCSLAFEKGIAITNDVGKNVEVYSDPDLLREIFMNLISNAIKFCQKGDEIRIFVFQESPPVIAVKDTGSGIKATFIPDLFRHEIQTSCLGTSGEQGTGLGLLLCSDIMKALGGSITVESTEGKGSVFYLHFPQL